MFTFTCCSLMSITVAVIGYKVFGWPEEEETDLS
jgi:hypothetical protein